MLAISPSCACAKSSHHHVDLDAGPAFGDLPDDLVAAFLADEITRLRGAPHVPGLTIRPYGDAGRGDGSADATGTRAGFWRLACVHTRDGIELGQPTHPFRKP